MSSKDRTHAERVENARWVRRYLHKATREQIIDAIAHQRYQRAALVLTARMKRTKVQAQALARIDRRIALYAAQANLKKSDVSTEISVDA
jgi:hypothetical protein